MALKKTVITPHGFTATDAYHRVEEVRIEGKTKLVFSVRSYKEPGFAAFGDKACGCEYALDGANPIEQAYTHVKTLPDFADAVDC